MVMKCLLTDTLPTRTPISAAPQRLFDDRQRSFSVAANKATISRSPGNSGELISARSRSEHGLRHCTGLDQLADGGRPQGRDPGSPSTPLRSSRMRAPVSMPLADQHHALEAVGILSTNRLRVTGGAFAMGQPPRTRSARCRVCRRGDHGAPTGRCVPRKLEVRSNRSVMQMALRQALLDAVLASHQPVHRGVQFILVTPTAAGRGRRRRSPGRWQRASRHERRSWRGEIALQR